MNLHRTIAFLGLLLGSLPVLAQEDSRLGAVRLDPVVPHDPQNPSVQNPGRLGSMLIAQIPPQPVPGQNPNTIRPPVNPRLPNRPNGVANPNIGGAGKAGTPGPARTTPPNTPGTLPPPAAPTVPNTSPIAPATPQPPRPTVSPGPASDGTGSDDDLIDLQLPNVPMSQILLLYEDLTGLKIIRDINIEAVTFTIETSGKLPKKKAIEYIEKSLLLNGYGFIPAGEGFVKFGNLGTMIPGNEYPTVFNPNELPKDGEQIVTYIHPLQYIEPDDLKKSMSELIPMHPWGKLVALPNSRGIAVTENSNTIRYILRMLDSMDVPPSRTEKRTFQLTRASAENVAKALADILGLEGGSSSGGNKSKSGSAPQVTPQPTPAGLPGQPQVAAQQQQRTSGVYGSAPQAAATPPKLVPLERTNKLMVIGRPADIEYIATLIEDLDAAPEIRNFIARPLKYLQAQEIMQTLGDALASITDSNDSSSGSGAKSSSPGITGSNNNNNGQQRTTGNFGGSGNGANGSGMNSFGSGYGSGSGGGGGFGSGGGGLGQRQTRPPQSLVLGKALLIADPVQNEIFVSGPPEYLETINQILDQLDVRPQQVFLSVVIGQLTLSDGRDLGVDYLFGPHAFGNSGSKGSGMVAGATKNRLGNTATLDPTALTSLADVAKGAATGLSVYGTLYDNINIVVSAASTNSNFKVLSRPSIFTLNNEQASIETGQQIPVPASTYSSYNPNGTGSTGSQFSTGFQSNIQYMDVSLRLDVLPIINSKDEITLQIKQVNKELGQKFNISGNEVSAITNQGLETTVITKTDSTVLLGGLIREQNDKSYSGIPVLRNLPLLKYVFGATKESKERRELLVFIQPRIVNGNGDLPNDVMDSPGASPFGEDARRFVNQEKSDPAAPQKLTRRSKIGNLIRKLFD